MSHVTSYWAQQYGLVDPASTAADIEAADPGIADAAARLLNSEILALRFGRERAAVALSAVESGWSTTAPHDAVRTLMSLSDQVEQACQDTLPVVSELSAAIAKAHGDVVTAYAAADDAIAAMGLGSRSWTGGVDEMLRIDGDRAALVVNLNAAIMSIARSLDAAAQRSAAAMTIDPAAVLPPMAVSPAAVEHHANTALLGDDLRSPAGRRHHFALAVNSALQRARDAGYTAQLLRYDPDDPAGQGGVAIAIGDVSQATSVAVLVPGVGNSPVAVADGFELAHALNAAADTAGGRTAVTATVLWFGYDIPLSSAKDGLWGNAYDAARGAVQDSVRAIDAADALMGGASLAAFVHALRPLTNPAANLSLIGHSYGSTTVAQAARYLDEGAGVDDVVLLGSPGAGYGVTTARDLRAVQADHVYSLSFPLDPVPAVGASSVVAAVNPVGQIARKWAFGADSGPFGPDPTGDAFDANVIAAPSNVPADSPIDFDQHALTNYLSGRSLDAIGAVVAARYRQVPVRTAG